MSLLSSNLHFLFAFKKKIKNFFFFTIIIFPSSFKLFLLAPRCGNLNIYQAMHIAPTKTANIFAMVHRLDGNSEIGAHGRSNFCYLICLKHLIRSRAGINLIFPFSFIRAQHVLRYYLI